MECCIALSDLLCREPNAFKHNQGFDVALRNKLIWVEPTVIMFRNKFGVLLIVAIKSSFFMKRQGESCVKR
jgi:hypothetical protein